MDFLSRTHPSIVAKVAIHDRGEGMFAVLYLYLLGGGLVVGGVIRFLKAIVDAAPNNPSLDAAFTSCTLILSGLAVIAVTRLLYLACRNSAAAA